jgi:hypothetical protein
MAVTPTLRLLLNTWTAGTDAFTRAQRNADAARLEAVVPMYGQGTIGARPAATAANAGTFYTVTDATGGGILGAFYYCQGAAGWLYLNPPTAGGLVNAFLFGG